MVRHGKKYKDIVSTAKKLFWKHGMKRVSIEEICSEAKVSKMTFYKYFSNKNELALTFIKEMFDENVKVFKELMEADISYEEKMERQLKLKLEGTKDISQEFVRDVFNDVESDLHIYWKKRADEIIAMVIEHYKEAQQKGWLRKDVKIDFILYMINKSFEFANDDYLISKYDNMQDLIMEINKFFLYGILPHNFTKA